MKYLNLKNFIILVGTLAVLNFGIGLVVSPMVSAWVVEQINKTAGTKISVSKVNVWPLTLSLGLKDLKVFDPQKTDMRIAEVRDLSARLSLLGLLSRRLVISSIKADGVGLILEGESDGSFNIQKLGKPKGTEEKPKASPLEILKSKKDWFAKVYDFLKKRYSKEAQAKEKEIALEKRKVTKQVAKLPKGRRVHFKKGMGRYLVEIKGVAVRDFSLNCKSQDGRDIDISKATMEIGDMGVDPELGVRVGRFYLAGGVSNKGVPAGSVVFRFAKAAFEVNLKDVNLDAVRFIYENSLPVDVVRGTFNLDSKTNLADGALDSRNTLSLSDHEFRPRGAEGMVVQALNNVNPAKLNFNIAGTLEKPEFSGFMKSLTDLVKPSLKTGQDLVKNEAAKVFGSFLK